MQKGDGPFKSGEYLTAAKLNQYLPRPVKVTGAGGIHSGPDGDVLSVDIPEEVYIKLTGKNGTSPIKYSWQELARNVNGTLWQNCTYNGTFSADYAIEQNNSNLSTTDGKVYLARRSETSGEMIFSAGGGGGNATFDIKGKDILLMLLGTYDEYKNCPDVPPDPPKHADDTLCEPAYAWAAYKICGYKFNKLFDMREFGVWAHELNGQSVSSWWRFHPSFWGWDNYTDGIPTGDEACAGVRFLKGDAGAITCSCPAWVADVNCMKISFKTIARPCVYDAADPTCGYQCGNLWAYMDEHELWDTTFEIAVCKIGNCSFSVQTEHWSVSIDFEEITRGAPECFWGPDEYDPCEPCDSFGRWYLAIEGNWDGNNQGNCQGSGVVRAYFLNSALREALLNCLDPALPSSLKECNQCDTDPPTNSYLHIIEPNSIEINCCTQEEEDACTGA